MGKKRKFYWALAGMKGEAMVAVLLVVILAVSLLVYSLLQNRNAPGGPVDAGAAAERVENAWTFTRAGAYAQARDAALTVFELIGEERGDEHDPLRAEAYLVLGIGYLNEGQPALTETYMTQALLLSPDNPLAFYYRGLALRAGGQDAIALVDFHRVLATTQDPVLIQSAVQQINAINQSP
jgi:tetratricopeptide (TPR) repeat protein